jgi:PAS domain S-box-containing protein
LTATFERAIGECFGTGGDSIEAVERRARGVLAGAIVWEGDAQTFQFSFVSPSAEALLGFPARRWIDEPTFWADVIITPEDRNDAIAYCALATAKRADHVFEYRARRADGGIVWLRDYVRVVVGPRGVARTLRGIMIDVSAEKVAAQTFGDRATYQVPDRATLDALA